MVAAGEMCGGNREGWQGEFGEIYGKEGEASKLLNIYFCLCVSKEILAKQVYFSSLEWSKSKR